MSLNAHPGAGQRVRLEVGLVLHPLPGRAVQRHQLHLLPHLLVIHSPVTHSVTLLWTCKRLELHRCAESLGTQVFGQ